jgi:hypothetical protein
MIPFDDFSIKDFRKTISKKKIKKKGWKNILRENSVIKILFCFDLEFFPAKKRRKEKKIREFLINFYGVFI